MALKMHCETKVICFISKIFNVIISYLAAALFGGIFLSGLASSSSLSSSSSPTVLASMAAGLLLFLRS